MKTGLYIIVPVHSRLSATATLVRCLQEQSLRNFHLILIDDGSTDGTSDFVRKELPDSTIITGDGSLWWGGSLEQGYRWIRSNVKDPNAPVLIINDDVEFGKEYLATGVRLLRDTTATIIYTKAFSKQSGKIFYSGVFADWRSLSFTQVTSDNQVNCVSTRGIFLTAGDFMTIGGFHPTMLPHYTSDYEFTIRAFNNGIRFRSSDLLTLTMDESTSGFRNIRSGKGFLRQFFSKKNPNNPIYFSMFILLSCPPKYMFRCWWKVWRGAGITVIKGLLHLN